MAEDFTVLRVKEIPAAAVERAGKKDTHVTYTARGQVNIIVIPKDYPASEADILAAIRHREKGIHPMTGKSYPL